MKSLEYYNSFWYRFTKPIKRWWFKLLLNRDKLIKVDDRHRGIGKTYMMIERAMKEDIPIVVGGQGFANLVKRNGNPVDVLIMTDEKSPDLIGKRLPNGVMIDESLNPKLIAVIKSRRIRVRGGFISNYGGDKK